MNNLRYIVKNLFLGLLMVLGASGFAQIDRLSRAQQLLQAKQAEQAKTAIDSVIQHPETKADFVSWTTRAYIYFEIYKQSDRNKLNSPLRDTIVSSLRVSNKLKPDADYKNNNDRLALSLSTHYYNLAKTLLQDSLSDKESTLAYTKFKELYLMAHPDSSMARRDVEFYNALGSVYSDIFNRDNNNQKAYDIAKVAFLKVFDHQPDNVSANMNMGLMYLNQGINLAKTLDYGADLSQIDAIQESIVKLAKQSEQFILKVYKQEPKNEKAIIALYYIYRMMNDLPKQEAFLAKAKALNIKLD